LGIGAPDVVLLHGFAGSTHDWDRASEALGRAGLRAIAIDLPGHGATAAPADATRYTMAETAHDLCELLDDLRVRSAHWIGYSMGGRLALYLAAIKPDRVESLVLESASPGLEGAAARAARRAADEALAAEIEARGIEWFAEHWAAQPIFDSQRALPADRRAALRGRRLRNDPRGLAGSLRGLGQGAQPWLGDRLGSVRCPTLLIAGALDSKYAAIAEFLEEGLPRARRVLIPDAGHNVHLEQPEAYERTLLDHLRPFARVSPLSAPSSLEA
jgi:2-succinyl-6-hydroxy-2,4-cyclohexadiene-1-carboxylate synthase